MLCCGWNPPMLPISFRVTSLTPCQSCDWTNASKATLENIGQWIRADRMNSTKQIKRNQNRCIFYEMQCIGAVYRVTATRGTRLSLAQEMACHLFGAKPSPEPVLTYCQLDTMYVQIEVKYEAKYLKSLQNSFGKYRRRNCGHFLHALVCGGDVHLLCRTLSNLNLMVRQLRLLNVYRTLYLKTWTITACFFYKKGII